MKPVCLALAAAGALAAALWTAGLGCGDDGGTDAADDGGTDAGDDGGTDAGDDGGTDAADDGGTDAADDGGTDAADDGGTDTTPCASDAECAGGDLVCNANWGICVVASCTGQPNFEPCLRVDSPDRSYDICVDGACVSPGCGDATCNAPGPNWTLADTGQRTCYDNVAALPSCPGTPGGASCETTAFCGQDAQYGWDTAHAATERFARTTGAEPVVTDNVTGLMWMGCSVSQRGDSCTGGGMNFTWSDAVSHCDGLSWGGYADWRLPDRYELRSIWSYEDRIDPTAFPATPSGWYWSSSSYAGGVSWAWIVEFIYPGGVVLNDKPFLGVVRCVRHGP